MKKQLQNKRGKVYYTIEYDPANHWNYSNWLGFVSIEEVIAGCEEGLELIIANGCPSLLNDNRQISGPWSGANEWIVQSWMPRALEAGLKRFAHIVSPNVFSALSAQQLVSRVEDLGFEMRIFEDQPSAEAWLKEGC